MKEPEQLPLVAALSPLHPGPLRQNSGPTRDVLLIGVSSVVGLTGEAGLGFLPA
jgi:hypothetical protein